MLPQSAVEHYRSQQRLATMLVAHSRREWARMGADFDRSWVSVGPRLTVLSSAAQLGAARAGAASIPRMLAETGQHADAEGLVNATAFSGTAADGRSLDGLLYGAVTQAKTGVGEGNSASAALESAGQWLDMVLSSIVADAGRAAAGVAIAARPGVGGYVRMLNPPSCNRCAVLAGKWFKWNQGFRRHPRCDCVHIPAAENLARDLRTDPVAAIRAGQVTGLSDAATKAILEDGADVSQVINASRGMQTATVFGQRLGITLEGTTVRGLAGQRLGELHKTATSRFRQSAVTRLTPESIYQVAGSRENTIRLLRQYGYLI